MDNEVVGLPGEEVTRLQRCINDLISVLAFPAIWAGRSPPQIVSSFVDGLVRVLRLDIAYVRLTDPDAECLRATHGAEAELAGIRKGLRQLGGDLASWPRRMRIGARDAEISISPLQLGLHAGTGLVVAGSQRADFPSQTDSLLLNVAANQLLLALQEARLRMEQERAAAQSDRRVAERTAELAAANAQLRKEIGERKHAETQLRESEALLLEAQRLSNTGSWKHDLVSGTVSVSPELAGILALTSGASTMPLAAFLGCIHPDDRQREAENYAAALRERRGFETTFRVALPDGSIRQIDARARPRLDEAGELIGFLGVAMDVTEQHNVHAALRRAFDEIQKSESKLRQVIDTIPVIAWCNLPEGPNDFLNKAWGEYTGLPPEESHGWAWQSAMHPEDLPVLMKKWQEVMTSGLPDEIEGRFRRHDGVYRWFVIRTAPLRDETGRIVRWYGTTTDIDDRKRAEEALRASEREFIQIVNTIPALTWSARPDGSADFFSESFVAYTGRSVQDLRGWGWTPLVHPDDLPALIAVWESARDAARPSGTEARLRRYDGEYRWFLFRGNPVFDETGNVTKWYGINTDIDDRRRAEESLRRSEAFLAEGQNLARIGNFSWLVSSEEMKWSEQLYRIFEFESGTPVTLELLASRVHPEDSPLIHDMIDKARRSASDLEYACRLLMPDGTIKHLQLVAHATRDHQGRLEYLGAVQDVTQRQMSEEALGKARAELANVARATSLGVLTAAIAHEVNQPISGIITNASTGLRMLSADPPNVVGALETIRRTIRDGNRASDVIKRLRTLYTRKGMQPEPMDLNDAAREVVSLTLSELQRNGAVLRQELAADLPLVNGDRIQLQQVILNLLRNAADAMRTVEDRAREVVIRTEVEPSGAVRFSVSDVGIGFPPQAAEKIFEPFHTTKSDGMGIGLSVSRSIIEAHGGRLWATLNEGPGVTFLFSLPLQ